MVVRVIVDHQKDLMILPKASGWAFPSAKYKIIEANNIIITVINKLNKISFFRLDNTKITFLIASDWLVNFINFNILKILTILNRKVSLSPGKIREGRNEIKSTKAWNEKINFILPVIPLKSLL